MESKSDAYENENSHDPSERVLNATVSRPSALSRHMHQLLATRGIIQLRLDLPASVWAVGLVRGSLPSMVYTRTAPACASSGARLSVIVLPGCTGVPAAGVTCGVRTAELAAPAVLKL